MSKFKVKPFEHTSYIYKQEDAISEKLMAFFTLISSLGIESYGNGEHSFRDYLKRFLDIKCEQDAKLEREQHN